MRANPVPFLYFFDAGKGLAIGEARNRPGSSSQTGKQTHMKPIALAALLCAAFAGSAAAQSSVTVYGRINTTVEYQDNGDDKVTSVAGLVKALGASPEGWRLSFQREGQVYNLAIQG